MKVQNISNRLSHLIITLVSKIFGFYKRNRLICLIAFLIIIGLVGIYFAQPYRMIDFSVYYYAGLSLLKGRTDLYASDFAVSPLLDYRYPPLFVLIVSPLALLSQLIAGYVWYWLCILEIGGSIFFVRRMIAKAQTGNDQDKEIPQNPLIWILSFFAVGGYFIVAVKFGNAHILLTFLLFGAFYFLMRQRDGWAAGMISLAITLKIIPLILLPYFIVKRRWKFVILTVVFSILLNLAPAFYFGFDQNLSLLRGWYQHVVVDHESHEKSSWVSISLKGQLLRYLTREDYSASDAGADHDYPAINIVSIPEETSNQIWLAASSIIYIFCLLLILYKTRKENSMKRRSAGVPPAVGEARHALTSLKLDSITGKTGGGTPPGQPAGRWRYIFSGLNTDSNKSISRTTLVEYSLIICLMLFIGPLTPKLYFIMLLLPVAFLASTVFDRERQPDKINCVILILIAVANTVLPLIPGRTIQRLFLAVGVDFYIVCLLMIVCINLLISRCRAEKSLNFRTE